MVMALFEKTFTTRLDDREACIAAFNRHDAEVRRLAPANRLVVWEPGDGWEPLCKALNLPIPDEEYPKTNSTEEFRAKIAEFNTADAK